MSHDERLLSPQSPDNRNGVLNDKRLLIVLCGFCSNICTWLIQKEGGIVHDLNNHELNKKPKIILSQNHFEEPQASLRNSLSRFL